MKKYNFLLVFMLLLLTACGGGEVTTPAPTESAEQTIPGTYSSPSNIRANGILLPIQKMELSFGGGGFIERVEVRVGEVVQVGQVLVRLDTTEANLTLQQLEARLAAAQANYDLVVAGAPDEQQVAISAANLELIVAQQALDTLYTNADLAAAQALQEVVDAQQSSGP